MGPKVACQENGSPLESGLVFQQRISTHLLKKKKRKKIFVFSSVGVLYLSEHYSRPKNHKEEQKQFVCNNLALCKNTYPPF